MGEEQPRLDLVRQAEQVGVAPGGGAFPGTDPASSAHHTTPRPSHRRWWARGRIALTSFGARGSWWAHK